MSQFDPIGGHHDYQRARHGEVIICRRCGQHMPPPGRVDTYCPGRDIRPPYSIRLSNSSATPKPRP